MKTCLLCNTEINIGLEYHLKKCHQTTFSNYKKQFDVKIELNEKEIMLNEEKLKDTYTYVKCELCGLAVKSISSHIFGHHKNINYEEYKLKYPNSKLNGQLYLDNLSERLKGDKNPNHKLNTTEEKRKSTSPKSIEFYRLRFPEISDMERQKMLDEHVKKATDNTISTTTIEYYLNKGMSQTEATAALKERQTTFSLEKCIMRHGEIEGTKKWKDRQDKWKAEVFNTERHISKGTSKISEKFIDQLLKVISINESEIMCKKNEKFICDKETGFTYKYDFTVKTLKKIIEFNGDFWHCIPSKFKPDYYHKVKEMTAEEIWKFDEYKINLAKKHGYDVLIVWEHDWMKKPNEVLETCINFLNNNQNND